MRRTTFGTAVVAILLAGCGNTQHYANNPKPAVPVDLTVYINSRSVSVSPNQVGAGQVVFTITNEAKAAEALAIHAPGSTQALASTSPINPQETAQVTVDFQRPGTYQLSIDDGGSDAQQAQPASIQPAQIVVGSRRPPSTNQLLQP